MLVFYLVSLNVIRSILLFYCINFEFIQSTRMNSKALILDKVIDILFSLNGVIMCSILLLVVLILNLFILIKKFSLSNLIGLSINI